MSEILHDFGILYVCDATGDENVYMQIWMDSGIHGLSVARF